jgi:hypothetical protein
MSAVLNKREYHYTISWKSLREIGINLEHKHHVGCVMSWIDILKKHMPEMLRLKGYNIDKTPQLSLDYFYEYINAVFNTSTHPSKPSGKYLYSTEGFRVLVDDEGKPIAKGWPL